MAKRESRRRRPIIKALQAQGWLVDSNPAGPSQRKGRSDLTVCAEGQYIAVEVKVEDDDLPEPAQVRYLLEVQQRGGLGFVTRDPRHAVSTIQKWLARYPMVDFDFGFLDAALGSTKEDAPTPNLEDWSFDPSAKVEQDDDGTVRLVEPGSVIYPDGSVLPPGMTPVEKVEIEDFYASTLDPSLYAPGATGPMPHVSTLRTEDVTPAMQQEMVENALNGHSLADEGLPVSRAFEGFGVLERIEWKLDELCRVLGHGQIARGERPALPPELIRSHTSVDSVPTSTTRRRGPGRPKKAD